MSPLAPGQFTIRSALDSGLFVGRDFRNVDQRILTRPNGSITPPLWQIERAEGGRYSLKTEGFSTLTQDKFVYTTLDGPGETWTVTAVPQHGRNQFIIVANDGFSGWVLQENNPFTPVAVQPLIVLPSEPPQFPPTERWIIRPLGNLD